MIRRVLLPKLWSAHHGACEDVLAGLPDASVDLIFDDPPYGIGYRPARSGKNRFKSSHGQPVEWRKIHGDETINGGYLQQCFRVLKDGGAIYLCTRWDVEPSWRELLVGAGFRLKSRIVWRTPNHGMGDLDGSYANNYEDILFAHKGRHKMNRRLPMLLDLPQADVRRGKLHAHQKPTGLIRLLLESSTQSGDLVLDPHAGSFSTGEACARTDRRFIGIEIDQGHYATGVDRLKSLTWGKFGLFND